LKTITKKELVKRISYSTGERQKIIKIIIDETLKSITNALTRGERIELRGFGVFKIGLREAKTVRNPKTGERIKIPSRKTAKFKPGKTLFKSLNQK
jgi:nucleoid DNA-binding protein